MDDIISTGGTIARASEMLKRSGAQEVYALCTHGLFIGLAIERLTKSTDGFMSTDTIESKYSEISVDGGDCGERMQCGKPPKVAKSRGRMATWRALL